LAAHNRKEIVVFLADDCQGKCMQPTNEMLATINKFNSLMSLYGNPSLKALSYQSIN